MWQFFPTVIYLWPKHMWLIFQLNGKVRLKFWPISLDQQKSFAYLTNFEKWNAPKMSKQKRQTIDNLRKSSVPEAELPVAQEAKNPFVCYLKLTLYLANMSPPPKIQAKRKVTPHLKKWEHRGGGEKWVSRVSSIQGWHKETTLKAGKIYWSWSFTKSLLASSIFNRLFKGQFSSLGENETDFSVTKENPEDPFSLGAGKLFKWGDLNQGVI